MLFKTGIEPKWEDEQNKDGGKWTLETNKQFKIQLDASWLEERDQILKFPKTDCEGEKIHNKTYMYP